MNAVATFAIILQVTVTLVGGGYALYRFAAGQGANRAKLDRIVDQVEPKSGGNLRDELKTLSEEMHRFAENTDKRLQLLERK